MVARIVIENETAYNTDDLRNLLRYTTTSLPGGGRGRCLTVRVSYWRGRSTAEAMMLSSDAIHLRIVEPKGLGGDPVSSLGVIETQEMPRSAIEAIVYVFCRVICRDVSRLASCYKNVDVCFDQSIFTRAFGRVRIESSRVSGRPTRFLAMRIQTLLSRNLTALYWRGTGGKRWNRCLKQLRQICKQEGLDYERLLADHHISGEVDNTDATKAYSDLCLLLERKIRPADIKSLMQPRESEK